MLLRSPVSSHEHGADDDADARPDATYEEATASNDRHFSSLAAGQDADENLGRLTFTLA
jgi:hypothetical protein